MCLIAFAWRVHAAYPLIVAANRDEFFARPTAPATWWPDGERLAGRDLRADGTWMGVAKTGRFAALTNHRDPRAVRADVPSRGTLVGGFLASPEASGSALARIAGEAARYNGFNLIAADWSTGGPDAMWVVANPGDATPRLVPPGVHALSNARLDTPWPKVAFATTALGAALDRNRGVDALIDDLFTMLGDSTIAADRDLPRTGVPLDVERALSAPFIRMPGYGTRSSTVVIVDGDGRTTFVERTREPELTVDERRFAFVTRGSKA